MIVLLPAAAACDGVATDQPSESEEDAEVYEGLSPEQIEMQAEPMSLEEAESLGIVDTTIRLQPPMNPDSVIPLDTAVIP